jgi:hypothetical protein
MVDVNKVIMSLVVIMLTIVVYIGCYSPVKPSEDIMKQLIIQIYISNIGNDKIATIRFDKFNIINDYFFKEKDNAGEGQVYCINLNYILVYTLKDSRDVREIAKDYEHYVFNKRENRWYGQKGWCKRD